MSELIEKLEKSLKRVHLQKFVGLDEVNIPLDRFIYNLFYEYNRKMNCKRIKNNTEISTRHTMRSLHDIYSLCRYYYKDPSLEEILKIMFDLCKRKMLHGKWKCNTIKRYVFSIYSTGYDNLSVRNDRLIKWKSLK